MPRSRDRLQRGRLTAGADALAYYMRARTHLALAEDCPVARASGRIVATPEVGGLHHRYERVAA